MQRGPDLVISNFHCILIHTNLHDLHEDWTKPKSTGINVQHFLVQGDELVDHSCKQTEMPMSVSQSYQYSTHLIKENIEVYTLSDIHCTNFADGENCKYCRLRARKGAIVTLRTRRVLALYKVFGVSALLVFNPFNPRVIQLGGGGGGGGYKIHDTPFGEFFHSSLTHFFTPSCENRTIAREVM